MEKGSEKTKPIQSQFIRIAYCVLSIAKRNLKKQNQLLSLAGKQMEDLNLSDRLGILPKIKLSSVAKQVRIENPDDKYGKLRSVRCL